MIRIANIHEPCPHNTAARRTFDQSREITEIKINNTQHLWMKTKYFKTDFREVAEVQITFFIQVLTSEKLQGLQMLSKVPL